MKRYYAISTLDALDTNETQAEYLAFADVLVGERPADNKYFENKIAPKTVVALLHSPQTAKVDIESLPYIGSQILCFLIRENMEVARMSFKVYLLGKEAVVRAGLIDSYLDYFKQDANNE